MNEDRPFLLIAERDSFMRDALRRVLEERFEIEFIGDGAVVLERVKSCSPALVILEVLLPTLDGFQVCQQIKNDPVICQVPVLFFTLLWAEDRAVQAGADGFLLKPLHKDRLLQAISRLSANTPRLKEATNGNHSYSRAQS